MPRNIYEPLKTYFLKVNINCQGCKMKVKKTLRKVEGVYSVDIDTDQQAVIVRGNLDPEVLVKTLNRRGKHAQLMFLTPYFKDQFGNHQAGQNRSWMNTLGSNNMINNVPSYERHNLVNPQSDEEMMTNMMKPVMMNDADYFQMNDSAEDFQELFGEIPRRGNNNNYEDVVNPNLMRDMELGYSNVYPAGETMNMEIGGRGDNMMVNERGFHGQMMNGPSLVPQSMNYEQFSTRPLQSMNHEQFSSRPLQPMNHEQFSSRPVQSMNHEQFSSRPLQSMNYEQFSSRPLHGFYY
ncbi:Heavy metal-associated isoprenylated plant protein 34 [Cardamine amara subsp. amara]|uniref:Heavy metal-associated isoprenylated plant protein 34 n=1 Tax=Cardamine amara subsp. amara TaxID=228776 RepID=A0ABD1AUE5_CARAN